MPIPPAPAGRSGCEHMGVGHKLAAQLAHRDRAYGVFLTPDFMMSDGSVTALDAHARAGRRVVLCVALRFGEEPLFANLEAMGLAVPGERRSQTGAPLVISGRQLAAAGIRSFHSETARYEWQAAHFTDFPCACWWSVPGDHPGIVIHSLSWCPLLLDYAAVTHHDTSVLDSWTLDADYVYRNFGDDGEVYVVRDSDEMMLVSWAPLSDRAQSLAPSRVKTLPLVGQAVKGAILRGALTSGVFDPLKARMFFTPVRWHGGELGPAWRAVEQEARDVLLSYLPDFAPAAGRARRNARLAALGALGRLWVVAANLLAYRARLLARLGEAARGDRQAWRRIGRRILTAWRTVRGAADRA